MTCLIDWDSPRLCFISLVIFDYLEKCVFFPCVFQTLIAFILTVSDQHNILNINNRRYDRNLKCIYFLSYLYDVISALASHGFSYAVIAGLCDPNLKPKHAK